ncbi:hypothetical protein LJR241_001693 [Paraburkholderia hospita]
MPNEAFESCRKWIELNLQTDRSAIDETGNEVPEALSGKSLQGRITQQGGATQLAASRIQTRYSQRFAIASNSQLEIASIASERFVEQQCQSRNPSTSRTLFISRRGDYHHRAEVRDHGRGHRV